MFNYKEMVKLMFAYMYIEDKFKYLKSRYRVFKLFYLLVSRTFILVLILR